MTADLIIELIDKAPEIKKNFKTEQAWPFSSYNWKTQTRTTTYSEEKMIFKNPEFMSWRDELVLGLSQLKQDEFISDLRRMLEKFSGIGDFSRFERVECKLSTLRSNISDYIPRASDIDLTDERVPEKELLNTITRILLKMQRNNHYDSNCDENTMNDYVRDLLGESYQTKDQTRQGISEDGDDAGEVDIQLLYEDLPVVMIEGLILDSVAKDKLHGHLNKVMVNYDPNGCPYAVLVIYYKGANLAAFQQRVVNDLNSNAYEFPYEQIAPLENVDTGYGELKHSQTVLNRNDQKVRVHIFSLNIR